MPAYNAALTLEKTLREIDRTVVDDIIVVDDASRDDTVEVARRLGLHVLVHDHNRGYGGNQKTCYTEALATGADVVVMLHPDYQYTPKLLPAMASLIAVDQFDVVLGSRILSGGALRGGMPLYKYVANRFLTATENLVTGAKLSEYHTGYRAFSRAVLETLPLEEDSDDFVFDSQMLAQCIYFGFRIGEVSCPTRYEPESSSINFRRSVVYGLGVLGTTALFRAVRLGLVRSPIFSEGGRRLVAVAPPAQAQPKKKNG
jgi:glycosyltransferase involved in cell wall biosynthesis